MKNKYIFTLTITEEVEFEDDDKLEEHITNYRQGLLEPCIYHYIDMYKESRKNITGIKVNYEKKENKEVKT